jgi:tRNA_anti-like
MKTYVKIALFVVSFIALSAILAALYMFNLKHTDMAKAKPDFIITASVLQKEFEDNEAMASAKYINKILEVTGTIASLTPVDNNNLNISLKTGSDFSSVICTFPAITDPSKFKTGDEITLRGECSGFTRLIPEQPPLDVLLNNCAPIMNKK